MHDVRVFGFLEPKSSEFIDWLQENSAPWNNQLLVFQSMGSDTFPWPMLKKTQGVHLRHEVGRASQENVSPADLAVLTLFITIRTSRECYRPEQVITQIAIDDNLWLVPEENCLI